MAINNTLKDIREERNLIQADLAKAIGSCSQTIGRIERGERNPSLEITIRLAHYLKVPIEDIFRLKTEAQQLENRGVKSPVFFFCILFQNYPINIFSLLISFSSGLCFTMSLTD